MFQLLANTQVGRRRSVWRHLLHRINTLAFLLSTAVIPQLVYVQRLQADQGQRSGIIVILADDLGYTDVGFQGCKDNQSSEEHQRANYAWLADTPHYNANTTDEQSEISNQRTNRNEKKSEEVSSRASNDALASKEELYLDRKLAFANPEVDNPDLPNVLLIGDSISIGYTAYVRRNLNKKADVYRIPTNAKNSAYGLEHLNDWLEMKSLKWDVIHFNWGLWDLCYRHPESTVQGNRDKVNGTLTESLEDYRSNVEKIVARLKQTDATLIWCATTPVPEGEAGRKLGDDIKYNQVAAEIMKANGVKINDLHSHALLKLPKTMVREGDVHFTEEGYVHLANKVATVISEALPKRNAD